MTDRGDLRGHDPEATVVMPVVPNPVNEPTVLLPTLSASAAGGGGVGATGPAGMDEADGDNTGAVVARHGAVMAVGSLVSRGTGFLRTAVIGAAIGASFVADDYNLSNTLPGMVYELLLGGVLASVIVPLLIRARANHPDRGEAYTQRLLTMATVFLAAATALAVLCAPLLTMLFTNDRTTASDRDLITALSYLILPVIFFYGVAALLAAVLNTRGHFAAPMWAPILNNLVVITMAVVFMLLPTVTPLRAESLTAAQILVLGLGTTLGIVVQAAGLWPALRKVDFRWKWRFGLRELHVRELARISAWMLAYVVVSQVGLIVVLRLAKLAGDQAGPGPAVFNNAYLIFMMAHGIVAVSIITALMPRMATAAAQGRWPDLVHQLSLGTRLSAVVLVPAAAAYVVFGRQLGVLLFEYGEYTHERAVETGTVIAIAGLGLVPFAISQLQLFAFYAMPDTKTPAVLNVPVVALRLAVDVLFYLVLPAAAVAAGLMGGNAISFLFAAAVGYWLLRRRIGRLGLTRVLSTVGRLMLAAALAAIPAWLVTVGLSHAGGDGHIASAVQLVVGGAVLLGTYVALAYALKVREVRELSTMIRTRLPSRDRG